MLIIGLILAILFSWLSETMFFDKQFGTVPIVDHRIKAEDITASAGQIICRRLYVDHRSYFSNSVLMVK